MFCVYILTNPTNQVLCIGVTGFLSGRIAVHTDKLLPSSFSARYNTVKLVHYEVYEDKISAYRRERQLKNWRREWKRDLITRQNPAWKDLEDTLQA